LRESNAVFSLNLPDCHVHRSARSDIAHTVFIALGFRAVSSAHRDASLTRRCPLARHCAGMPEDDDESRVSQYRREAADLRRAAEIVRDESLREQLLSIAQQYEALADRIERKRRRGSGRSRAGRKKL
jgi:hypothetical protein